MPLFKSKKSKPSLAAPAPYDNSGAWPAGGPDRGPNELHAAPHHLPPPAGAATHARAGLAANDEIQTDEEVPNKPYKYAPELSKTRISVGGLPVNVFGLSELTPSTSRALRPRVPDVAVVIHMHGRGGSADKEERIVRHLWDCVNRSRARTQRQGAPPSSDQAGGDQREFLLVSFDARNHGHRLTDAVGQKGWKQGNKRHALDLYSMIRGTAQDVSHLVDMLPSYLFPQSDREVVQWCVTGKSLGGHAAWHVLANDPRVTVGVPFIGCPSYANLLADRTKTSFVTNGPPYVPHALAQLVRQTDPASSPYWEHDARVNPFYGKKICICSGANDKLVPWRCSREFVENLVVGPTQRPSDGLKVVLVEGAGHEVTEGSERSDLAAGQR